MDEYMLNDLLECSVCLERLDTSSRVLPCQHTFCKKCLEEIVSTKKELRCPECRVLVNIKIEDLPPNVLLMRILGGMRNAQPKNRTVVPNRMPQPNVLPATTVLQPTVLHHATAPDITRVHYTPKQALSPNQPYARAVYDYLSNEPGDLKFKKGDIILLRKKMDANWYHGESGGNHGVFPLTYVQVVTPLPSHIPQCKALYDFRMTNDDEEGCLTFNKGEVITVIRRVDENWAEGKLVDRIGIFPLAFVELNNVARALMKLSSNSQPGPSRLAPPTPTSEDMTPLIPTDHTRTVATSQVPPHHPSGPPAPSSQANSAATPHHHITMGGAGASDSSSTVSSASSSTTTPNTSSSNTSSSSSTAPSSPASPPPPRPAPCQGVSSPPPRPAHNPNMSPPHVAQSQQNRGKRHSFSTGILHAGHPHQTSHRHSAEILAPSELLSTDAAAGEQTSQAQPGEPPLQRQGSQRHRRSTSADTSATGAPPPPPPQGVAGSSVAHLPAAYVALYPYRPQKADEVELKKGGVYMVTERCQDGWFKGTSHRTQKGGVFPGNYVAPAKSVSGSMQAQLRGLTRPTSSPSAANQATCSPRTNGTSSLEPASTVSYTRIGTKQSGRPAAAISSQPPELPPRATSPHVAPPQPAGPISTSWHGPPGHDGGAQSGQLGRSQSAVMSSMSSPAVLAGIVAPPNVTVVAPRPVEKAKERKEKSGVSLMRRLTNIKKSKSPPPMSSYSMDNPVFEDGSSATASPAHPVHVRLPAEASSAANCGTSADFLAQQNSPLGAHQHRKSNSLDAGEAGRKPAKPVAPPVRERFRCIVPYPPNSDYELELRVGDIIYVHKKRDDGWYKGTQQRTGRTGLFPASFVETF